MKKAIALSLFSAILVVFPGKTMAQENNKHKTHVKNIIEVDDNVDKTTVKFPGGNIEVNNFSDTITKVTLGHKRIEVIEGYNKTRVRVVRVPIERFKGHFMGVDLGFNGYMASGFTTELPPEDSFMDLHNGKSMSVSLNFVNKDINRFFISAGPYAGFLVKAHTKVVYEDNGSKSKEKYKGNLNVNPFQYGAMIRFGYRWIKFYATYNFSALYMKGKGPELYPYSIGLTLANF